MKDFQWLFAKPIAHRGLHDDIREENSLPAFRAAVEKGYGIELDVYLMRDGQIAVFHDQNIKRVCGVKRSTVSLTAAELQKYPMLNGGEIIPTLPQVLDLVDGKVPLLIELKTVHVAVHGLENALLKCLENYKGKDTVAIQSFNPVAIKYLSRKTDFYPLGQLATMYNKGRRPFLVQKYFGNLRCLHLSRPDFIAYDIRHVPNKHLTFWKQKLPVLTWTVNNDEKMRAAQTVADNIIFERISPSAFTPVQK